MGLISLSRPMLYDSEMEHWPWGEVLRTVAADVCSFAPFGAKIHDYMCGTGWCLGEIARLRPDLKLTGFDINTEFLSYATKAVPSASFIWQDVRRPTTFETCSVGLCTGALHHLREPDRWQALRWMWCCVAPAGQLIVADEVVDSFASPVSRLQGLFRLYQRYRQWMSSKSMPTALKLELMRLAFADVLQWGEYKYSFESLQSAMASLGTISTTSFVWPGDVMFGDVIVKMAPKSKGD